MSVLMKERTKTNGDKSLDGDCISIKQDAPFLEMSIQTRAARSFTYEWIEDFDSKIC